MLQEKLVFSLFSLVNNIIGMQINSLMPENSVLVHNILDGSQTGKNDIYFLKPVNPEQVPFSADFPLFAS